MAARHLGVAEREMAFIAELALAGSCKLSFRKAVFDRLSRVLGWDLCKGQSTPDGGRTLVTFAHGWVVDDVNANVPRYLSELTPAEMAALTTGRPRMDSEVLSGTRRDRLALYREQMRPHGISQVATVMWRSSSELVGYTLARAGRGVSYRPRELNFFERLLPSIKLAEAYLSALSAPVADGFDLPFGDWVQAVGLTARERAVTELVVRGLQNREVAELLGVAPTTVRNHLASVFRKAEVTTRSELVFTCTQPDPAGRATQSSREASRYRVEPRLTPVRAQ